MRIFRLGSLDLLLMFAAASLLARFAAAQTSAPLPSAKVNDMQAVGDASVDPRTVDAQPADVQTIFRLANEDRVAAGLASLNWNPELAVAAQAHARIMAANRVLSHQYPGETDLTARVRQAEVSFSSVAENIATGNSARQIDREWMQSPPHRANLLDPRMNALGVAVVSRGGALYAVEDFAASVPLLTPDQVERSVEAELQALTSNRTMPGSSALFIDSAHKSDVRRICSGGDASGVGQVSYWTAPFEVTWQGADLSLPAALLAAIRKGQYHTAAVGACVASSSAFTVYRVSVVLD